MRNISPAKAALSVGSVIGLYHLAWASLVALELAKPFMDFVLRLHFIRFNYEIAPFDVGTAAGLVALTFTIGAMFGLVFALIWNWLAERADSEVGGQEKH
jgi:ribose/xylose/arabinose/galactoside ABC-type transport system permease subunit